MSLRGPQIAAASQGFSRHRGTGEPDFSRQRVAGHAQFEDLLDQTLRQLNRTLFEARKLLSVQLAIFNAFEDLTTTVERIPAFTMAGEGVADYLFAKRLQAGTAPDWVTTQYRRIHEDEAEHGNYPFEILVKHATAPGLQEKAARAVAIT